jgi:hypothetical protein
MSSQSLLVTTDSGWVCGWMDGWMGGWLDGHISKRWMFQFSVLITLSSHLLGIGPELY